MALEKYSRVDGRKSSNYCSTISTVVFVAFCLVGIWMLMSSIIPVENSDLPANENANVVKEIVTGNVFEHFKDSSGETSEDLTKRDSYPSKSQDDQSTIVKELGNTAEENQEEMIPSEKNHQERHAENTTEEEAKSEDKTKMRDEKDGVGKLEDGEDNSGDRSSSAEAVEIQPISKNYEWTGSEESLDKLKTDMDDNTKKLKTEESSDGIKKQPEVVSQTEDKTSKENKEKYEKQSFREINEEIHEMNQVSDVPAGSGSEILNEATTGSGSWSTQVVESQNEKESLQTSISKGQSDFAWKVCNATAGSDYIPCLDNWLAIRKLPSTKHYEHRERHCPYEAPTCLVAVPVGYRTPIKWPKSREKIWYYNVPHTKLAEVKGHQNWVKVTGEYLTFPGGGTQFKNGALPYIEFIQKALPCIAWGKRSRVILDVGCGVASFGGYLFEKDVLTMSFAPKDEHEAQVQFALERGIPALLGVMGTKRLPFPSSVFDVVHCARCRVPWHIEGGKLLLELNRVLRPGGYFVWSATPVYRKLPEDVGIWKAMSELTKSMCWDLVVIRKDKLNGVAAAIYRKPTSNECYDRRSQNEPPLCKDSDDSNAAWNVPLQACMHKVPVNASEQGAHWPELWPLRLEKPPYWLKSQVGVYGRDAHQDFTADYQHWKNVVSQSYMNDIGIDWSSIRNVMDMRSVYGGFAGALKDFKVWVMNVVPVESPDTLQIIYDRGLFGIYHDWCESFNTYPRSYDLLHADHLFSNLKKRCNIVAVIAEVDRILRPKGKLIIQDNVETISQIQSMVKSLHWKIRFIYSKDNEGVLCVEKTLWHPSETETITAAIL